MIDELSGLRIVGRFTTTLLTEAITWSETCRWDYASTQSTHLNARADRFIVLLLSVSSPAPWMPSKSPANNNPKLQFPPQVHQIQFHLTNSWKDLVPGAQETLPIPVLFNMIIQYLHNSLAAQNLASSCSATSALAFIRTWVQSFTHSLPSVPQYMRSNSAKVYPRIWWRNSRGSERKFVRDLFVRVFFGGGISRMLSADEGESEVDRSTSRARVDGWWSGSERVNFLRYNRMDSANIVISPWSMMLWGGGLEIRGNFDDTGSFHHMTVVTFNESEVETARLIGFLIFT